MSGEALETNDLVFMRCRKGRITCHKERSSLNEELALSLCEEVFLHQVISKMDEEKRRTSDLGSPLHKYGR